MSDKKLEDCFASVNYSSRNDNAIEITIIDDKVKEIVLEKLHIVSSKSVLYLYLNDTYPIFKLQIDNKLQLKEYHHVLNDNCLIISIEGYKLKESIESFKKQKCHQLFFKYVLGSIYAKYKYQNSILLYHESLKKKMLESFKLNYYTQLKKSIAMIKLIKYRKILYSKEFLFKCQIKLFQKMFLHQKRILLIYRTFFGKVAIRKVANEERVASNAKSFKQSNNRLMIKALKGFVYQKHLIIELKRISDQFQLNKTKERAFKVIFNHHCNILRQKERIKKYNRMNYVFLDYIADKYIKEGYSLRVKTNKELLLAFFALLKNNKLKMLYIATKLARIAIMKSQLIKIIRRKQLIAQRRFMKEKKKKDIKKVYNIFACLVFKSKVSQNSLMIMDCVNKQRTFQSFFSNIAIAMSNKLKVLELNKMWTSAQTKYRLFEFLSSLFFYKTLNETKVVCRKVTSSFEIVSLRLLTKRKKKMVQTILEQNSFNRFRQGARQLKLEKINECKKQYIIKNNVKKIQMQFILSQRQEAELRKKVKLFKLRKISKVYKIYKKRIQFVKWSTAAIGAREEKTKHISLIVLGHYSKFRKEKIFRNNYFNGKLNNMLKKYLLNKYLIKTTVILKCIKVVKMIQVNNNNKRVLSIIKQKIKSSKIIHLITDFYQKQLFQYMHQAAYAKHNLNEKTQYLLKKTFHNLFIKFNRIITMRKKIQKHYLSKIQKFNIKRTILNISSVIKSNYIMNYRYTKFYYKHLSNSAQHQRQLQNFLKEKKINLMYHIPFVYFKSMIKKKNKIKCISFKYYSYIIRKRLLKPSRISKLVKALFPMMKYNKILILFFFMRQMKYISSAKKVIQKRRVIIIKSIIHHQLIDHKYNITIKKLIRLFNIKQNLKHFMIIVLQKIRNELISSKLRGVLIKKSFKTLRQKDDKQKRIDNHLKDLIHTVKYHQCKFELSLFFHFINRRRLIKDMKAKTLKILKHKEQTEYKAFFNTVDIILYSQKKKRVLHQRYFKDINERFLNVIRVKLFLLKQSSLFSFKSSYRQFLINSINCINNTALVIRKNKFVQIKSMQQLCNGVHSIKSSKNISSSKAQYFKSMRSKKIKKCYFQFTKQSLFLKKEEKNLKKRLFQMLKQHCVISRDINFYLNQAEALMI